MANCDRFLDLILKLNDDRNFQLLTALLRNWHFLVGFRVDNFILEIRISIWKFEGDCFKKLGHVLVVLFIKGSQNAAPFMTNVRSFSFGILTTPIILSHFIGVANFKNNAYPFAEKKILLLQDLKLLFVLIWKMSLQLFLMAFINHGILELLNFQSWAAIGTTAMLLGISVHVFYALDAEAVHTA